MTQPQAGLTARAITKKFPGVTALDRVDFELLGGEVHVLVGENGAGKSTLVRVLAGVHPPDGGELTLWGRPYRPQSPLDAIRAGVRVVHQELSLLPFLSVAENLFFERLPRRAGLVDHRRLASESRALLAQVGLDVSPRVKVERLSTAQRQLIEIARALSARSRVLVLDEPTASLTGVEAERLFEIIGRLRGEGVGIVYISHHLDEVFEIGDRVTVLRNGRRIATQRTVELDVPQVVRLMVGRDLASEHPFPYDAQPSRELLRVEGVRSPAMPEAVSFTLREGEILGMAGLVGAGRTETVRALFGADRPQSGRVLIEGREVRIRRPRHAVRAGISFVTEDRKSQGLVLPMGCDVNITLADIRRVTRAGMLRRETERSAARRLAERLAVRAPSVRFPAGNLSGGNQQKVVLARWLFRDGRVLIVDEPTKGVDVGARHEIYTLLADLARQGRGIVMVSSDLPELLGMCHRILVFSRGRVTGELTREEFDSERILTLAYQGYLGDVVPSAHPRAAGEQQPPAATAAGGGR